MFNKLVVVTTSVLLMGLGTLNAADAKKKTPEAVTATASPAANDLLETPKDKISYTIGWDIGNTLKKQYIDVDTNILIMGIEGAINNYKKLLSDEEMQQVIAGLREEIQTKREEAMSKQSEINKKEGAAFLAKNKLDKGVKVLPSGLQYKVIENGKGPKPKSIDTVKVNYSGKLIDGTEFDSSYKRGVPATFPVTGVIPGWTEVLQLMKAGSKWQVFIPSNLAYGERGAGETIGPDATLIFTVELLEIQKPEDKSAIPGVTSAPSAPASPKVIPAPKPAPQTEKK
ncbi:MAG: FKBP-type peptidyl-prolyl cis-trans isomerase [Elusimicrobiota bacterium]